MSEDSDSLSPDSPVIGDDLPCIECGYNLRGLREGHRCPECGSPIQAVWPADTEDIDPQTTFKQIAGSIGMPEAAVWFVFDAVCFTAERLRIARTGSDRLDADVLMWGIRDYALEYFGSSEESRRRLERIGLGGSDSFGKVLEAFRLKRVFWAFEAGALERFASLFTLDTLFVARK